MKCEISGKIELPAIYGMNLEQIKKAIAAGRTVCWSNEGYEEITNEEAN